MANLNTKWMIRSSDVISGPYTTKEIYKLLEDGDIPLTVEVTKPCSLWIPLLEHPDFQEFIKTLDSNNLVTKIITKVTQKIPSFTTDADKTVTAGTEKIENTKETKAESFTGEAQEAVFEVVPTKNSKPKTSTYSSSRDYEKKMNKKITSLTSFIWKGIAVLFICVSVYVVHTIFLNPLNKNRNAADQVNSEGMKFYRAGAYDKAFPFFKSGLEYNLLNFNQKIIISSFLVQNDKGREAKEILNQLSSSENQDERVFLVKGLAHFYNKEWSLAESYFLKAKDNESNSGPINIGILKFKKKNYVSSLEHINQMIDEGYTRGLAYYLDALNRMKLKQKGILFHIQGLLQKTPEYHQEIYLMLAYLYLKQGNRHMSKVFLKKSLNEDPFFSSEYQYSSFAAKKYLNWEYLLEYCEFIYNLNKDDFLHNLMYGFCYLKSGIHYKGMEYIEKAKNQDPNHSLVLSIYGYSLITEDSLSEAEAQLELAINYNVQNYDIPNILSARLYERMGKWPLALKHWERILYNNEFHITAMAGVAYSNFKLDKLEKMRILRDQILRQYPYYSKALLLKD